MEKGDPRVPTVQPTAKGAVRVISAATLSVVWALRGLCTFPNNVSQKGLYRKHEIIGRSRQC